MAEFIVGMDVGGTNLRAGLVDRQGILADTRYLPVKEVLKTPDVTEDLARFLEELLAGRKGEAIVIGLPAPLDRHRKVVLQAPNLPYMDRLPLAELLQQRMGMTVLLERDVNLLLCYDMHKHNIPPEGITCGFYFGTGIGNAIFVDGKPFVGKNGAAGELGHIPADGSDELCGCGNRGCMENLAGGKFLAQLQKTAYPETPLSLLFTRHGADAVLLRFVDRMAQTISTELNILDPDYVLLGGGVLQMADFPRDYLEECIAAHTRKPYPAETLRLIYSGEEPAKGVLGAAQYYYSRMQ